MAIWTDLLFGDGFWLGFILIEALLFIISASVKYGGYFSGAMATIMFIVYYQNVASNSMEYWGMILMGITVVIHILIETTD